MNLTIIKSLSLPGFVTDAEALDLCSREPHMAAFVSEVCVGAEGLSKPLMRISGINQAVDGVPGVVLSTSEGRPVALVYRKKTEEGMPLAFHALHCYIRDRGNSRHEIASTRASYVVKKVRERLGAITNAKSGRDESMFASTFSQVLSSIQSTNISQKVEVRADKLLTLLNAIKTGGAGIIGTSDFDSLYAQCDTISKSRAVSLARAKEEVIDRKWWFVVNHGDYGFAVYKTQMNTGVSPEAAANWGNGTPAIANSTMELQGWFKSLNHMQQIAPDLYQEFYVQLVMTKQMVQALRPVDPYPAQVMVRQNCMFDGSIIDKPTSDVCSLLPMGDFYFAEAAVASWTYSNRDAKTGSYTMLERI